MSRALVVATIRFKDRDRYERYASAFPTVFQGSGGAVLAAAEDPLQMSGPSSDVEKIVVLRFDSEDAAHAFLSSPEYQRIAEDRDAGADVTSWILKGF